MSVLGSKDDWKATVTRNAIQQDVGWVLAGWLLLLPANIKHVQGVHLIL
jgi:hypothetical protein